MYKKRESIGNRRFLINKKAVIEFGWLFAVIVGAMILFLAFYFVGTKLLSQKYEQSTIQAHSLEILLNPFSQFGEIKLISQDTISLDQLSTVNISCDISSSPGDLGYNEITITTKGQSGIPKTVYDKYIFAENDLTTKKFQALSVPLEMPWRAADVIILWPYDKKYCFVGMPNIKETLGDTETGLNISSLSFTTSKSSCPSESITVCNSGCDITINPATNKVTKQGQTFYFASDALMYASIFSSKGLYDCNFKRIASRVNLQATIYEKKALALSGKGCTTLPPNLGALKNAANELAKQVNSDNVNTLWQAANNIDQANNIADCSLY